jgi:two-component system, sensor histidine kinase and response regulator
MRLGLTGRILIGGGILAVVFAAQFVIVLQSFRSIRHDTREESRAEKAMVSAVRLEKLVVDLETGTRGYVITRDRQFLQPYEAARRALPAESVRLRSLAPGSFSAGLERQWRAYVTDYAMPLIRQAAQSPRAAQATVASGEGKRRVDRIRGLVGPFAQHEDAVAARDQRRIDHVVHSGVGLGVLGSLLRLVVLAAIIAYLLRWVVAPIRHIAVATERVAAGELDVEVPQSGPGELGQLARSFNEMSHALTRHQASLAEQNVDLERLANVLRAVLDSTIDGILLSDAEGNMQLANRPLVRLTREMGMSYEGTVVDRLLSVEHRVRDKEAYHATMEGLRDNPDESTFDEFEDIVTGRVFQGFTSPVLDDRGGFIGRLWTLRDVTEQRELDRLKDDFVATVSHELRTPLTSMMGFLEMIREGEAGDLNEEQQRFLAIVYRSSERLQRLVGDLLFVARLDANGLQLQFGEARLDEIVRDAVESSGALARSREVALVTEVDDMPPVSGDKERLSQLVGNLISNALKFTPAGGRVVARAFVDGGRAVVEIADTGIGIPPAEQSRLFQRFFRSSTATEQAIPGTGLGLVISRAIAEAHGGTIDVTSLPGEGTTFRVEIPLDPEEVAA